MEPNYYLVISSREDLEDDVNSMIDNGYIPLGGPIILDKYPINNEDGRPTGEFEFEMAQAVVKGVKHGSK